MRHLVRYFISLNIFINIYFIECIVLNTRVYVAFGSKTQHILES